jgi:hypothetical protein
MGYSDSGQQPARHPKRQTPSCAGLFGSFYDPLPYHGLQNFDIFYTFNIQITTFPAEASQRRKAAHAKTLRQVGKTR